LEFASSNNIVDYKAHLSGLDLVDSLDDYMLVVFNDSHLMAGQCREIYKVKRPYLVKCQ
jgi:ribonuclease HI